MKGSAGFKQAIEDYLTVLANTDDKFAKSFAKPNKNIDECVTFILNTVKESGASGFDDGEIYGIAVHYYDEDELDPKYLKGINMNVVVNHKPVLTPEVIAELEQKAKDDYYQECLDKQRKQNKPKAKPAPQKEVEQLSLF